MYKKKKGFRINASYVGVEASVWGKHRPMAQTQEQEVREIQGEGTVRQTILRVVHCHCLPAVYTAPSSLSSMTLLHKDGGNERPQCHPGTLPATSDLSATLLVKSDRGAQTTRPRCCGIEEQKQGINILPLIPQSSPPRGTNLPPTSIFLNLKST